MIITDEELRIDFILAVDARNYAKLKQLANEELCAYRRKAWPYSGMSALQRAARMQDPVSVEILLSFSNPDSLDCDGNGALGAMCNHCNRGGASQGAFACAKLLLAAGADPRAADADGIALFHRACMAAMTDVALELLPRIDIEFESQGWTPLMACAHSGDERLINAIFPLTKTPTKTKQTYSFEGFNAVQIARSKGNHRAAALIEALVEAQEFSMAIVGKMASASSVRI